MSKYRLPDFLIHCCQAVKSNFRLNVRKVKQRAAAAGIKS